MYIHTYTHTPFEGAVFASPVLDVRGLQDAAPRALLLEEVPAKHLARAGMLVPALTVSINQSGMSPTAHSPDRLESTTLSDRPAASSVPAE